MMSIHSSMVFITVHFSVCFQSVVLTSIVHRILYQRRNKSIHSLLSKMKFSRFLRENHLISHAKRQRFFLRLCFLSHFSWFGSRTTLHFVRGLFVVCGCVGVGWHAIQQIYLNHSLQLNYIRRGENVVSNKWRPTSTLTE